MRSALSTKSKRNSEKGAVHMGVGGRGKEIMEKEILESRAKV